MNKEKKRIFCDPWSNYDILDLQFTVKPLDVGLDLSFVKLKVNEMFKDYKLRNGLCKLSI